MSIVSEQEEMTLTPDNDQSRHSLLYDLCHQVTIQHYNYRHEDTTNTTTSSGGSENDDDNPAETDDYNHDSYSTNYDSSHMDGRNNITTSNIDTDENDEHDTHQKDQYTRTQQCFENIRNFFKTHSVDEARIQASYHSTTTYNNNTNMTPLHLLCQSIHPIPIDIIKVILRAYPDATSHRDIYLCLPLHYACYHKASHDVLNLLIRFYPDALMAKDYKGRNPLHFAVVPGHNDDYDDKTHHMNQQQSMTTNATAITSKRNLHQYSIVLKSPKRQPHIKHQTQTKNPIPASIIKMLCRTGAASARDDRGMLPIHYAAAYGSSHDVLLVLMHINEESLTVPDHNGLTCLDVAMGNCERNNSFQTIQTLLAFKPQLVDNLPNCNFISSNDNIDKNTIPQQHPIHRLAARARHYQRNKSLNTQTKENIIKCLSTYLDFKPKATTLFLSALQSLPPWLLDEAVVHPELQSTLNGTMSLRFPTALIMLDLYALIAIIATFSFAVIEYIDINTTVATTYNTTITGTTTSSSSRNTLRTIPLIPLYIGLGYFLIRTVTQILSFIHLKLLGSWIKDIKNWLDLTLIALTTFWTIFMAYEDSTTITLESFRIGASITLLFLWIDVLNFLRSVLVEFAVFVSGVIHVVSILGTFLMVLGIILVAFMQLFYTVFHQSGYCDGFDPHVYLLEDPYRFCTTWDTFLTVYAMLLGEVEDADFQHSRIATIFYCIFVFLVVILLGNVLIAIVTDSYAIIRKERAAIVFWSNRLDFVIQADAISNGPWRKKIQKKRNVNINNDINYNDIDGDISISSKTPDSIDSASKLWTRLIELLDGDTHKYGNAKTLEFCVYILLCICIVIIIIPVWIVIGLLTAGWYWPSHVRKKIFEQKITKRTTGRKFYSHDDNYQCHSKSNKTPSTRGPNEDYNMMNVPSGITDHHRANIRSNKYLAEHRQAIKKIKDEFASTKLALGVCVNDCKEIARKLLED